MPLIYLVDGIFVYANIRKPCLQFADPYMSMVQTAKVIISVAFIWLSLSYALVSVSILQVPDCFRFPF